MDTDENFILHSSEKVSVNLDNPGNISFYKIDSSITENSSYYGGEYVAIYDMGDSVVVIESDDLDRLKDMVESIKSK